MSVDTYEQMTMGVSDITSIALVTLEIINNTLLINELRLWFVCRELMGNLAARKHWLDINLELHTEIQCLRAARLPMSSRQTNQSLSSLINNVLFIISSVTSAMLVMSDTPVVICSYVSTDIEARPRQFVSTMIIDTQAGFRMTFTVVLRC